MADDQSERAVERPGDKASLPSPLPERARMAADAAARAIKGIISGEQDVSPGDAVPPAHTPTVLEEGEASGENARGRSLGEAPTSFSQRLAALRRMMPSIGTPEHCRDESEPDGR